MKTVNYPISEVKTYLNIHKVQLHTSCFNFNRYNFNKYWFLIIDKVSVMIWSHFENKKSELRNEVLPVIKHIKSKHTISYIRCENPGENQVLNEYIEPLIPPLTFKYTPIDTPQHNGVVKRK